MTLKLKDFKHISVKENHYGAIKYVFPSSSTIPPPQPQISKTDFC